MGINILKDKINHFSFTENIKTGVTFMKFTFIARKFDLAPKAKEYIEKRLSKLDKFFSDEAEARVVVGTVKSLEYIEAQVYSQGVVFRAEASEADVCTAADKIVDVIERQIRKNKTRLEKKLKGGQWDNKMISGNEYEGGEDNDELEIVKVKKFAIKPMTPEEAILQMNLLGHNFFVFKDSESNSMNVVYKRNDGKYAIIESIE